MRSFLLVKEGEAEKQTKEMKRRDDTTRGAQTNTASATPAAPAGISSTAKKAAPVWSQTPLDTSTGSTGSTGSTNNTGSTGADAISLKSERSLQRQEENFATLPKQVVVLRLQLQRAGISARGRYAKDLDWLKRQILSMGLIPETGGENE